jgi:general secretion pathway protein A
MYESFFAFKEKPFSLTPNPRFLFLSRTHNEVYAHLIYGIERRAGFVEVTGEVGSGKTTMLRTLLARLDENKYRVAFIFNPKLTAFELLRNINQEFGVADHGVSNPELIQALNEFLLEENRAGRTPILVIDEAQNLSGEVLEQIRLLSNLETVEDKLIQIILVGQPELRHQLNDHSLRQLNQRIAVRYQLQALNREETSAYIRHRLNVAGRPDGRLFSPAALRRVYKCSGGVPRRINLVCDRALLTAYSEGRGVVVRRDVNQAVAELAGQGELNRKPGHLAWLVTALTALLFIGLAGLLWSDRFGHLAWDATVTQADQPRAAETGPMPAPAPVSRPAYLSPQDSLTASCNAVFSLWGVSLLDDGGAPSGFDLDSELHARGLELVRLAGRFEDIGKFNLPLLLPLPEEQGGGYLAVTGRVSDDMWSVVPAYRGHASLSSAELNTLGLSVALVPWIDFASIGYVAVPGVQGENVRRLQFLLALSGCADILASGRYDSASISCVKKFQRQHGLVVDGMVGPRTLILLYQATGTYNMPGLS